MRDNLKKYIEQNREELEVYSVKTDGMWDTISKSLEQEKPKQKHIRWYVSGIAASLLLLTGTVSFYLGKDHGQTLSAEWQETEVYYQEQIAWKMSLVKNKVGDEEVLQDLELMDEAFADLKRDLNEDVNNEEVVRAMMENYKLKLRILERILNEIDHEGKSIDHSEITL